MYLQEAAGLSPTYGISRGALARRSIGRGGAAGAFFGNGFVAFLAEDIVRQDPRTTFQLLIIAHLHIMLTLIDVMILLLVIRTYRVEGRVHKLAVPLTIVGVVMIPLLYYMVQSLREKVKGGAKAADGEKPAAVTDETS